MMKSILLAVSFALVSTYASAGEASRKLAQNADNVTLSQLQSKLKAGKVIRITTVEDEYLLVETSQNSYRVDSMSRQIEPVERLFLKVVEAVCALPVSPIDDQNKYKTYCTVK